MAVSLAVTLLAFAATTWGIGWWRGSAGTERALPPAFAPAEARDVAAMAPPPDPDPAQAAPDAAAQRAPLAAAAEAAEEAARAGWVDPVLAADEPLELRLELYRDALEQALEASGQTAMLAQRGMWTEHFLRLEPVQQELGSLSPGDRANALAGIRRGMGFDDGQIERLALRDAALQARWDVGLAYMEERGRLAASFEGEALEQELRHLRQRTFGHEAQTIEREEADDFFRFERPRVYGRN
jgi:hypothetical protein